ncbi:MAG: metallophosphoesterase family protein [Phycisphaerales bacterium]|nr:metallophosphoesterase family protein [Phycisphaerales bacterium]
MHPTPAFRRPVPPRPIERYDLVHPAVPRELDGFTILQISDQHIRRARPLTAVIRRAMAALRATPVDLVVLTGDYMNHPGDEGAALRSLGTLARSWRARLGAVGIFGNHDSAALRRGARGLAGITWPGGVIEVPGLPLRLLAADDPEDLFALALEHGAARAGALSIALVHDPVEIFAAADLGVPLVMAGHTHGGQVRPWRGWAPHTSTDLPPGLATGILRYNDTLAAVSRGLGGAIVDVRFNCPPQIPLYTLRRGLLPPNPASDRGRLIRKHSW